MTAVPAAAPSRKFTRADKHVLDRSRSRVSRVRNRDGGRCIWCSTRFPKPRNDTAFIMLVHDHLPDVKDNWVLACPACLAKRGDRTWEDWLHLLINEPGNLTHWFHVRAASVRARHNSSLLPVFPPQHPVWELGYSQRQRRLLAMMDRDGPGCVWCGEHLDAITATTEHVVPRAVCQHDNLLNLVAACQACNSERRHLPVNVYIVRHLGQEHPVNLAALTGALERMSRSGLRGHEHATKQLQLLEAMRLYTPPEADEHNSLTLALHRREAPFVLPLAAGTLKSPARRTNAPEPMADTTQLAFADA